MNRQVLKAIHREYYSKVITLHEVALRLIDEGLIDKIDYAKAAELIKDPWRPVNPKKGETK